MSHDNPYPPEPAATSFIGNTLLTVAAAIIGAVLGSYITRIISLYTPLYIPVIPGFLVGVAAVRFCRHRTTLMTVLVPVIAFAGAVFCESICYVNPGGIWDYMVHFMTNASPTDWLFRVLNVGIALWYTRDIGRSYSPVHHAVACPHCGQSTSAGNKFCGHCGQAIQ